MKTSTSTVRWSPRTAFILEGPADCYDGGDRDLTVFLRVWRSTSPTRSNMRTGEWATAEEYCSHSVKYDYNPQAFEWLTSTFIGVEVSYYGSR